MNLRTELMQAVLSNPLDDVPRLALANWFIENEESILSPCHNCCVYEDDPEHPRFWKDSKHRADERGQVPARDPASGRHEGGWTNCKTCNGKYTETPGFLLESNRFAERGEFIKTQLEMHNLRSEWDFDGTNFVRTEEYTRLDARSRQLLHEEWPGTLMQNEALWLREHLWGLVERPNDEGVQFQWTWGRGFLDIIRLPLKTWLDNHQMLYWHPSCPRELCHECEGLEGVAKNCLFCDGTGYSCLTDVRALTAMPLQMVHLDVGGAGVYVDSSTIRFTVGGHLFEKTKRYSARATNFVRPVWRSPHWPNLRFIITQ